MADLVTAANAQLYNDTLSSVPAANLAALITAASAGIEKHCMRTFGSASYSERYDGQGDGEIWLRQFPVSAVSRISVGRSVALIIQQTNTTTNQRAYARVTATGLTLVRVASGVTTTDATVTFAANVTVTAVAAAVNLLGAGWSATVQGSFGLWPAADLYYHQGSLDCLGVDANLQVFDGDVSEWELTDPLAGWLRGNFPRGQQNVLVDYTAGFATIPEPIQMATALFVSDLLKAPQFAGGIAGEHLGDYSYYAPAGQSPGIMSNRVRTLLSPYVDHRA